MAAVIVYGLKTCDTCRAALKAFAAAGVEHRFLDIRAETELADLAPGWIAAAGADALINRRSTTWRGLSAAERVDAASAEGAAALLVAQPTLVKRPVIEAGGKVFVGWTPEVRKALGLPA